MDVPEGRGPVWIIIREMVNFNNFIGLHSQSPSPNFKIQSRYSGIK
jgi:hypothetical protein